MIGQTAIPGKTPSSDARKVVVTAFAFAIGCYWATLGLVGLGIMNYLLPDFIPGPLFDNPLISLMLTIRGVGIIGTTTVAWKEGAHE